ncbi:hypothetical protein PZA11_004881 [Diplocarpon coronariae]
MPTIVYELDLNSLIRGKQFLTFYTISINGLRVLLLALVDTKAFNYLFLNHSLSIRLLRVTGFKILPLLAPIPIYRF